MPAITPLLPNEAVNRLGRLRLQAAGRHVARGRGEHLAGKGGISTDFADHRDYAGGDDLRFVDWNAFARLQRPFLKQFRREEERHVVLVVDDSRSMALGAKSALARSLAAGLAVAALHGDDRVSVLSHAGELLPPCRGRAQLARALGALAGLGAPEARRDLGLLCRDAAARHRRGIAVVLSDFLSVDDPGRALHRLAAAGLEPWAVQVLDPGEIDPATAGDLALVDAEDGSQLEVSADPYLLGIYREALAALDHRLATATRALAGRHLSLAADGDAARILTVDLVRRGWLA
ncbi:MAG: DUF58 domain-containing protein [Planctomycetes bacterium]|nr:DUF58 domain-containing protein [Planctomycetota bacterium]